MSSNVIMYVKGVAKGNPGPSGVGIIICDHWGRILKKIQEYIGHSTPVQSEFRALLRGIEEIRHMNAFRVKIFSDNEPMIKHMTGVFKVKGDDLIDLLEQIRALSKGLLMEFIQIHPIKNREAEGLCREAIEKELAKMKPPPDRGAAQGKDNIDIRAIKAAVQRAMLFEQFAKAQEQPAEMPSALEATPPSGLRTAPPPARPSPPPPHPAAALPQAPKAPPPPPPQTRPGAPPAGAVSTQLTHAFERRMDAIESRRDAVTHHEEKADEELIDDVCPEEKEERQISAGGVVFKKEGQRYKICLIAKKNKRVWALPKGRLNPGENPEETARREISEETGHLTEVREKIDEISYYFYWKDANVFYHKTVYFYLMPVIQENYCLRDKEADEVVWLTLGEAYKKLTYINEKEILRKAQKILKR
jgi:8-oxo-dGTP diphosphatase